MCGEVHVKAYREVRNEGVSSVTEVCYRRHFCVQNLQRCVCCMANFDSTTLQNDINLLNNNKYILTFNYWGVIMTIERQYMERLANICRSRIAAEMAAYIIRNEVQ